MFSLLVCDSVVSPADLERTAYCAIDDNTGVATRRITAERKRLRAENGDSASDSRQHKKRKITNDTAAVIIERMDETKTPYHNPTMNTRDAESQRKEISLDDLRVCDVQRILSGDAPDDTDISDELRERLSLDVQRAVISDEDGDKPIHMAVVYGDCKLVKRLCCLMHSVGASIDSFNYMRQTPLHLAIAVGNAEIVKLLLEEGASPKIRDRRGNTVLHLAVKNESEECVEELLIKCKGDSEILDALDKDGFSPLHLAVLSEKVPLIKRLIAGGCNVNVQDGRSGRTPLSYAVKANKEALVDLLFSLGASPDIPDYAGLTPLGKPALCNLSDIDDAID